MFENSAAAQTITCAKQNDLLHNGGRIRRLIEAQRKG
jgi:hypothetical protein